MARPKHACAEVTHNRILEAATRLLTTHDPAAISLRRIAADAGVASSLIVHYFGSRDALYRQVLDGFHAEVIGLFEHLLLELFAPKARESELESCVRQALRFARSHRGELRLQRALLQRDQRLAEEAYRQLIDPALERISAAICARRPGRSVQAVRLLLHALGAVLVEHATSDMERLRSLFGRPSAAEHELISASERFVVQLAKELLNVQQTAAA
ncbi:MAG: TetR/AcrR family transcriptional regulator [Deltaproteobacteria bacterium]|nr:TetR/AcrR family transcriptional regulator [Deltaproteobacteria bacterium]